MAHPPPLQPEYYNPGPPDPTLPAGRATASMVCGILSLVMLCAFFPVSLAIVAVALGGRAQRDVRLGIGGGIGGASAHAGVVCGCIVLVLFGVALAVFLVAGITSVLAGH